MLQRVGEVNNIEPRGFCFCQIPTITDEYLVAMAGVTRPRISTFMHRFRELGLIEFSAERFLIVKEGKLSAYLGQVE